MFFRKKDYRVVELEKHLKTMRFNLENNYKDAALEAFASLEKRYGEYKDELRKNDSERFAGIINDYKIKLKDYHH